MLCNSFPFSFIQSNNEDIITKEKIGVIYTEKAKKYCPGISNDAPLIDVDYWFKVANRTLRELKDNHIFNKDWNNSVKNKIISPSAKNFIKRVMKMNED